VIVSRGEDAWSVVGVSHMCSASEFKGVLPKKHCSCQFEKNPTLPVTRELLAQLEQEYDE
jgi:hypothetical protein